jgi:hypothetical protein
MQQRGCCWNVAAFMKICRDTQNLVKVGKISGTLHADLHILLLAAT